LDVDYDPTSAELYRYEDASCPAVVKATTRQGESDGEEDNNRDTRVCFTSFGQFRLFVTKDKMPQAVFTDYYDGIRGAIEYGELQGTLDDLFPNSTLNILGVSEELDADFIPYDAYVIETAPPTPEETTSAPSSSGCRCLSRAVIAIVGAMLILLPDTY
jgi:hypothetical protein